MLHTAYILPTMNEPIGDLSNRMRDTFRLVVEAYLDRGQPVVKGAGRFVEPVASFDPRSDAGAGGAGC